MRQWPSAMSTSGDALPHVSDGVLPPHVEQQRTRVSVDPDAPRYTNTVEYAGAYFANGVDNSFSIERFKRDFRIEVQSMNEEEIVFDLIGIDAALANAFRRILISDVPTMAIDRVFVLNNTSMLEDEVLAHRLGLIPIRADPRFFTELTAEDDADEHNVIAFRLQVQCYRQSPGEPAPEGAAPGTSSAEDGGVIHNARVLSGQLQWIPQGEQAERFRDEPIRPVHEASWWRSCGRGRRSSSRRGAKRASARRTLSGRRSAPPPTGCCPRLRSRSR